MSSPRISGAHFKISSFPTAPLELRSLIDQVNAEKRVVAVTDLKHRSSSNETSYLDIQVAPLRDGEPAVKKALNRIRHAENRREATQMYWRLCSRWKKLYPRAVHCVQRDLDQLLSFFQIKNSQLWSRLRTTNLIERAF